MTQQAITNRLTKLRADLAAAQERKATATSGGQVADLLVELRTLESEGLRIQNELTKVANAEFEAIEKVVRQAQFVLDGPFAASLRR